MDITMITENATNFIKSSEIDKETQNIENIKRNAEISLKFKIIIALQNQKCFKHEKVIQNKHFDCDNNHNLKHIKSFRKNNFYQNGLNYYESLSVNSLKLILEYLESCSAEYET